MSKDIILASASPRRRRILEMMGLDPVVRPAAGEERIPPGVSPDGAVRILSDRKAGEVAGVSPRDSIVIAADTVVVLDGRILGKPSGKDGAREMLAALSAREHSVLTGLTVISGGTEICVSEETLVRFRELTEREIERYIATGEPMDKAGAYGIQGPGGAFVSGITGDFYNVMGLPLCRLGLILRRLGVELI